MKKYINSKFQLTGIIVFKRENKIKQILSKWHKNYKMETKITKINKYKMN